MKGLTHVLFGMGFVSIFFYFFKVPFILWFLGVFIVSPFFSRLPDKDQTIANVTFNQIDPHRGKLSHNLLIGLPLIPLFFLTTIGIFETILIFLIGSVFGALFAHSFVDSFNYAGIYILGIKIKGFLKWDSFWGNLIFRILGVVLILLPVPQFV
ncbi:metal-dependent hydrolase [Candidatus Hodarchaeum mangrovi]